MPLMIINMILKQQMELMKRYIQMTRIIIVECRQKQEKVKSYMHQLVI